MKSFLCILLALCSCSKTIDTLPADNTIAEPIGFVKYIIKPRGHYTTQNNYKPIETSELKFIVRFDSSAIYQSAVAENQKDINKLYGFSDNGSEHHQYSARFGWRWSDGALRLFAYVYNEGKVFSEELGPVTIGADIKCRIQVKEDQYLFYCNEYMQTLPRKSKTAAGKGYLLYPYFGGDEAAPHEVAIWIKDL